MPTKTCRACGEEKDVEEFYLNPNTKDGRLNQCKRCNAIRAKPRQQLYFQSRYATVDGRAAHLLASARSRAKRRGLAFDLDLSWVKERFSRPCEVTGLPFNFDSKSWGPSLDRIDSTRGYTRDNTQVVCWIYNRAKNDGGHDDVVRLANALVS